MIRTFTAPPRKPLPVFARYGSSVAFVAAAALATMELPALLDPMRFLFFWGAVLLTTLVGGTGAGLLAVALSVVAAAFLEFPWAEMARGRDPMDVARLAVYAVWASAISVAVGLRDAANRRVDLLREWLATTLHSIGDGVIVTDAKGAIVFLNPVAASLTGWPADEAANKPVVEIFSVRKEDSLDPIENPVTQVLRTGDKVLLEEHAVLLNRAGEAIAIDDSAAPIRSSGETIRGVVLVFRDVTRRRAAEKALIQADNAKDQFLATLSHDLRTPLTSILGWTRMLREGGCDDDMQIEALRTIEENATAQAALIEDILDLTRIAAGKIVLDRVDVDLGSLLRETASSIQPSLAAKRPRVFQRFQQAHGDHSIQLGGLGLGLAIVKDLAELHGGTVTAFSAGRGTGATFTVRLPLAA